MRRKERKCRTEAWKGELGGCYFVCKVREWMQTRCESALCWLGLVKLIVLRERNNKMTSNSSKLLFGLNTNTKHDSKSTETNHHFIFWSPYGLDRYLYQLWSSRGYKNMQAHTHKQTQSHTPPQPQQCTYVYNYIIFVQNRKLLTGWIVGTGWCVEGGHAPICLSAFKCVFVCKPWWTISPSEDFWIPAGLQLPDWHVLVEPQSPFN